MADPRDFTQLCFRIASTPLPYPDYIKEFMQGAFGGMHGRGEAPYHSAVRVALQAFWPYPLFDVESFERERFSAYGSHHDRVARISFTPSPPSSLNVSFIA